MVLKMNIQNLQQKNGILLTVNQMVIIHKMMKLNIVTIILILQDVYGNLKEMK